MPTLERYARMLSPKQKLERTPGWSFGMPLTQGDLGTFTRRLIWERYRDERIEGPIEVKWCRGLKLKLRLGNDVSWSVFVGGMYEPNELAFFAATLEPGMTVVDIGANEGLFSLVAASCVGEGGRVIAIEPSSREFEYLRANIALNQLANVEPVRIALYNHAGSARLTLAEMGHEGQNALGDRIPNPHVGALGAETVALGTLDGLVTAQRLDRLDLVKIDAEGSEARVLEGGQVSLSRYQPLLLIEIGSENLAAQGSTVKGLLELLSDLSYDVWVFGPDGLPRLRSKDEQLSSNIVAAHTPIEGRSFALV
jgi:FkbM family methyltransferase